MNKEALENYELSIESMRQYKPNSALLKMAKAIEVLGWEFESQQVEELTGLNRGQISKHRCGLHDSYGYEFKQTRIGVGRYYRYKLVDVTLQQSEAYLRRQQQKNERQKAARKGKKPSPVLDFTSLINDVFCEV